MGRNFSRNRQINIIIYPSEQEIALPHLECHGATDEELESFKQIAFVIETVCQPIVGLAGLVANLISLPILCNRKVQGMFFIMLASLAVFDSLYILLSLLEAIRRELKENDFFNYTVRYVTYPLQNIVLCITIFLPVALAFERYRAIRHPVEYHNNNAGVNLFKKSFSLYILPVILLSIVLCIPKWLELELTKQYLFKNETKDDGSVVQLNDTYLALEFTALRFDRTYIFWYNTVIKLMSTGILPFIALIVVNSKIYQTLKRRSAIRSHMTNNTSNHLKDLAANQAHTFFVICLVFMICHTLRVALGIHDLFLIETYRKIIQENCSDIKFSTLVAGSVSNILLTSNSSLNFAIYALMSREFRQLLVEKVKPFQLFCSKKIMNHSDKIEMVAPGVVIVKEQPSNDQNQERFSKLNDQLKISINESESYV